MKRVFSVLFSIAILFSLMGTVDLSAYASTSGFSYYIINPLYENSSEKQSVLEEVKSLANKYKQSQGTISSSSKYGKYPTTDEAASTLRDKMVDREDNVTVSFLSDSIIFKYAVSEIFDEAISQEISKSSQDGDYLKWHYKSVYYTSTREYISTSQYLYTVNFTIAYNTTKSQEKWVTTKINEINKALDLDGKSDYKKALAIHQYVCEAIKYDYEHYGNYDYIPQFTAYGGLHDGVAVCQSYATVYYRLCYENDLQCRIVTSASHAWNLVKIKGKNYYVDCTWNDTKYDDSENANGNYWSNKYVDDYFLVGSDTLSDATHYLESDYRTSDFKENYPISDEDFVCSHDSSVWVAPDGSNCKEGLTRTRECEFCGKVLETAKIPAGKSHTMATKTVSPTCTAKGYTLNYCKICDYSYKTNYVDAKGHNNKTTTTKATTSSSGSTVIKCTRCGKVASKVTIPKISSVVLSTTTYTYNGKTKKPTVTVTDSKGNKITSSNYTLTYDSGRKNVGKYTVTIKFKGNYSGTVKKTFTIKPKSTSISSVTAKSKGFTIKWKKLTTQLTGYQIKYSTSSSFDNAKTVKITSNKTTSKAISNLKANKKYYVRIRTYKTVNGKTYYSAWSKTKSITTKK